MHGSGTQAGGLEEMASVLNVFGVQRNASNLLTLDAVKAAVGYCEGVTGVTSLVKVLMMLKHGQIQPQPGGPFKINSRFPRLNKCKIRIALNRPQLHVSPRSADKGVAMLMNSFDASGRICSLALEKAPALSRSTMPDPRTSHVVAISARATLSLWKNGERLLAFLEKNPGTRLQTLAYTTTVILMHYALRKASVTLSVEDIN